MTAEDGNGPTYAFPNMDSDERLRELILYVSQRCQDDSKFGATKLNKILYFADFIAYRMLGTPITGAEYQRLTWGPAPRQLRPIRDAMVEARELAIEVRKLRDFDQHRTVALKEPNLELFSAKEISLVDEIIHALWDHTAGEASMISHTVAWEMVDDGESIPYQAAFLSPQGLSGQDVSRAEEIVAEYRGAEVAV